MRAALLAEFRKLVTTRLWWVLLIVMGAYLAFLAATIGWSFSFSADQAGQQEEVIQPRVLAQSVYGVAMSLGYVFPVIVGALSVTGEFRHKTITPTLLAEPRRTLVLGAKYVASLPVGLLFGLVGTLATAGGGAAVLAATGHETFLTEPEVLRGIGLSVLGLAVWTTVGVGLGAVLTNQVAAIVVLLAFTQFVEPTIRVVAAFVDWLATAVKFLPGAAGDAMVGASILTAFSEEGGDLLAWWQGLLVLVGYALLFGAIGRLTTFRRDIT